MPNDLNDNKNYLISIEKQALDFFKDYALIAFICIVIGSSLIALLLYIDIKSPAPLYWLTTIVVIQLASYFYRRTLPNKNIPHKSKLQQGTLINTFDGLVLCSCLIFLNDISDLAYMIIINSLTIACTFATISTVGYRPFYLGFSSPIMIAIIVSSAASPFFFGGSNYLYAVSAFNLVIAFMLNKASLGIFENFKAAFIANLKNIEINNELKIAVDKAKKANQSKTRFLASASHDLRQPMTTLSLFIATMSMKNLPPEEEEIITHMSTAINSIDAQLDSLLDISKLDAGIIKVNKTKHNIVQFVSKLVSQYNEQYKDENAVPIRFSTKLEHATALTDIILFERIIRNLVGNAIKYTPDGYIDINISGRSDSLNVTITDTGIGISADNIKQVFDEFYQAGNPERDGKKGLGLGLSIVKRMCELLDMQINIQSEEGIGTSATLTMECDTIHEIEEVETDNLNVDIISQQPRKRIIALDNEQPILNALKILLESMGHHVITFTDAKHALLSFSEQQFDLALIDYRLPGKLTGLDVINQMQRVNNHTKCFLVTGDSNIGDKADEYNVIYKPVTNKKLAFLFN